MSDLETVYAIQNFEAENEDELTFHIGEPIVVLQKDDGFNDGWWKGQNMRGEVGIFPMNYITSDDYSCQLVELPTPSNSDPPTITKKPSQINTSMYFSPERSSYSFNGPMSATVSVTSNNDIRKSVINTLLLPHLRSTLPKDWNIYQVETWLRALHFGSIAENFKAHEITGDVLMELDMESLKELDIVTFGKRFKVYNAIVALREECGLHSPNSSHQMSINTLVYPDDHQRSPTTTPPTSARYSSPSSYPKNSSSYYSNFEKPQRVKSFHNSIKDDYDGDQVLSPVSMYNAASPHELSPITPSSHYDIMEINKHNYDTRQYDSKLAISASKRDIHLLQQAQKHQIILPIAQQQPTPEENNINAAPDMEGWLYKQASKYKKWNKRWFVLKGPNLFYFKSPKDIRMKGIINLRGYRIIADETIQAGKYSFKAQHEEERTFYFYTDVDTTMKAWLSSLMKATISRDFKSPVVSSSMIPTVSLDVARRMRPRPPSVLYKKDEVPSGDLGYQTPISEETTSARSHNSEDLNQDSGFDSNEHEDEDEDSRNNYDDESLEKLEYEGHTWSAADYIEWVNAISGSNTRKISRLQDLKRGDVLIEILEELSGKNVNTTTPSSTTDSMNMLALENIIAAFKFMAEEGIVIDEDITIRDVHGGNEEKIKLLLEAISEWSIGCT